MVKELKCVSSMFYTRKNIALTDRQIKSGRTIKRKVELSKFRQDF